MNHAIQKKSVPIADQYFRASESEPEGDIVGGGIGFQNKALYRLNQNELVELKRQLTELLTGGYVRPSKSPFDAPIPFISKTSGQLWLCIDYRALNRVTVKNNYPLPKIDDFLYRLADASYFNYVI